MSINGCRRIRGGSGVGKRIELSQGLECPTQGFESEYELVVDL
jgi:hypothetical protein